MYIKNINTLKCTIDIAIAICYTIDAFLLNTTSIIINRINKNLNRNNNKE